MIPSISTKQNCFFLTKHHWSRVFLKKSETYLVEFLRSPYSECEESGILRRGGGKIICQLNSFGGKNRTTPCGSIWCYWFALFCSLWSNLSVLGSTQFSRAESKQVCKNQMSAEFKKGQLVNLVEVLSGTDSHLVDSEVFWTIRI